MQYTRIDATSIWESFIIIWLNYSSFLRGPSNSVFFLAKQSLKLKENTTPSVDKGHIVRVNIEKEKSVKTVICMRWIYSSRYKGIVLIY